MLRMGLENDKALQKVESTRWSVYFGAVASARTIASRDCRLGRKNQILGLIFFSFNSYPACPFQYIRVYYVTRGTFVYIRHVTHFMYD